MFYLQTISLTKPVEVPVAIASTRTVLVNGVPQQQVLVQWANCPPDEASWEDFVQFQAAFPSFHLEDKVAFEEGGMIQAQSMKR